MSLPCSGLPPVQLHHRAGPGRPVHGGDRPGRDCSDADEVPSGSRDRGLQLSRPSSNRVFRGHILSSPTRWMGNGSRRPFPAVRPAEPFTQSRSGRTAQRCHFVPMASWKTPKQVRPRPEPRWLGG